MKTFKPSEVVLAPPWHPLVATMNKTEAELAAALLIRALAATGDEWRPITWAEAQLVWRSDIAAGIEPTTSLLTKGIIMWRSDIAAGIEPTTSLLTKGIIMPDAYECIDRGYVTAPVIDGKTSGPFAFTEKGLAAIAKWARAEEGTAAP